MNKFLSVAATVCAATITTLSSPTYAQEPTSTTAMVEVTCPITGPGIAACATIAVLVNELAKVANGEDAFGPNGEVMKILKGSASIVDGNFQAATRERGELDKVLRATTGISVGDIKKYGLCGGPNSELRKMGCK